MVWNPSTTTDFRNGLISFLSVDDEIDLTTREVTIASWKTQIEPGTEFYPQGITSSDIFSTNKPGEWRSVAKRLVDNLRDQSVTSLSSESSPTQFEVTLNCAGVVAYKGDSPNGIIYSFKNMGVNLRGL